MSKLEINSLKNSSNSRDDLTSHLGPTHNHIRHRVQQEHVDNNTRFFMHMELGRISKV